MNNNNDFEYTTSFQPFCDADNNNNQKNMNPSFEMGRVEEEGTLLANDGTDNFVSHHQSTTTTTDQDFDDVQWSFCSNAFFITAGIFYLLATTWDYSIYNSNPDVEIGDALNTPQRILYEALWLMGPLFYLMNSIVDVRWALKVRKRDVRRKYLERLLVGRGLYEGSKEDGGEEAGEGKAGSERMETLEVDQHSSPIQTNKKPKRRLRKKLSHSSKKLIRRMSKHMGHRRDLAAASTFGIAAALSVLGCVCYLISLNENYQVVNGSGNTMVDSDTLASWAGELESASIHMYLVSAVFALWQNPCKKSPVRTTTNAAVAGIDYSIPWFQRVIVQPLNDVESMEYVGDLFFGVASVVDVILEDSSLDDGE